MSLSHLYRDGEGHMDDDEDERENFEITDWDLQNEFNPNRQRHWQTKEEATYGVWAERDSDEERPSFGGKRYWARGAAFRCFREVGGDGEGVGGITTKHTSLLAFLSPGAAASAGEAQLPLWAGGRLSAD